MAAEKRHVYEIYIRTTPQKLLPAIVGKVLEVVKKKKFVHNPRRVDPPSRVTYEISRGRGVTVLTVVHDRLEKSPRASKAVKGGWGPILSGLKTWLETGKPLFRTF